MRRLFACHHCSHSQLLKEQVPATQMNVATEVSQKFFRHQERRSSSDSKAMIREMGSEELFELCETIPKVQCSECLLCLNHGVIYCTCGHLLVDSEFSQNLSQWRLDALSIPHYDIKKERTHGARHGKTETQKEHFVAHNARKRCIKKNFDGIHDSFQRDPVYVIRNSKLAGWRRSALRWRN